MTARLLSDDDAEQAWRLSQLAFGWLDAEPPTTLQGQTVVGLDGPGGLAGMARLRSYEQWWGGRRVPMGGIAAVAVAPQARGRGVAATIMRELLVLMREREQPISVLYPTAPGIYRSLGWEVVGTLDDTRISTADLRPTGDPAEVQLRAAGSDDVESIARLYGGQLVNGLLTRDGAEFPSGPRGVLEHDVVTLALSPAGEPVGYATYARGSGYREGSELRVFDCVGQTAAATSALLLSLASWASVARTVRWRGPTDALALHLACTLPPPITCQPWMLRIVDAPAAVAARGFPADLTVEVAFRLHDPDVGAHSRGWRLRVTGGAGVLEATDAAGLPTLHVRGLALLYAGAADQSSVLRAGLLDRPSPALALAFAATPPAILDYF